MAKVNFIIKRTFDIISSSVLIVILFPLWIVIAVLIKVDSRGTVFYKQKRRTKNGKIFSMFKFRSMVSNAEKMGAGLFNYKNDPRVTKMGRFLRDTSLDELPQLINILKGDMSVVGPRPCVTYELGDFKTLNKRYKKRFQVKAGLTGLAQVMGRNDIKWDKKVEYDNQYVDEFKRIGVLIDIKILWLTILKVFRKENIYENKENEAMTDSEAAKYEEMEIIRIAHLPD